jgi:hypothetical protein
LNLSCCDCIRDVSALGGVHFLDMTRCHGINDVSSLRSVHTLILSSCRGVRDDSELILKEFGGVQILKER